MTVVLNPNTGGPLKIEQGKAYYKVTNDWRSALELKASESPLICLAKKGLVLMETRKVLVGEDGKQTTLKYFKLPEEKMIKYVLHPGQVKSKVDKDIHFITARKLAFLYKVNMDECVTPPEPKPGCTWEPPPDAIHLYPDFSGLYQLPEDLKKGKTMTLETSVTPKEENPLTQFDEFAEQLKDWREKVSKKFGYRDVTDYEEARKVAEEIRTCNPLGGGAANLLCHMATRSELYETAYHAQLEVTAASQKQVVQLLDIVAQLRDVFEKRTPATAAEVKQKHFGLTGGTWIQHYVDMQPGEKLITLNSYRDLVSDIFSKVKV